MGRPYLGGKVAATKRYHSVPCSKCGTVKNTQVRKADKEQYMCGGCKVKARGVAKMAKKLLLKRGIVV